MSLLLTSLPSVQNIESFPKNKSIFLLFEKYTIPASERKVVTRMSGNGTKVVWCTCAFIHSQYVCTFYYTWLHCCLYFNNNNAVTKWKWTPLDVLEHTSGAVRVQEITFKTVLWIPPVSTKLPRQLIGHRREEIVNRPCDDHIVV